MEVFFDVEGENAVHLARHLANTIAKNYKVYLALKNVMFRLQFLKGLSSEQVEKIKDIYNNFEKNQQEFFIWGNT